MPNSRAWWKSGYRAVLDGGVVYLIRREVMGSNGLSIPPEQTATVLLTQINQGRWMMLEENSSEWKRLELRQLPSDLRERLIGGECYCDDTSICDFCSCRRDPRPAAEV